MLIERVIEKTKTLCLEKIKECLKSLRVVISSEHLPRRHRQIETGVQFKENLRHVGDKDGEHVLSPVVIVMLHIGVDLR